MRLSRSTHGAHILPGTTGADAQRLHLDEIVGQNFSIFLPGRRCARHKPDGRSKWPRPVDAGGRGLAHTQGRIRFWANVLIRPSRMMTAHCSAFARWTRDPHGPAGVRGSAPSERGAVPASSSESVKDYAISARPGRVISPPGRRKAPDQGLTRKTRSRESLLSLLTRPGRGPRASPTRARQSQSAPGVQGGGVAPTGWLAVLGERWSSPRCEMPATGSPDSPKSRAISTERRRAQERALEAPSHRERSGCAPGGGTATARTSDRWPSSCGHRRGHSNGEVQRPRRRTG